jgi:hypothetical protein
MQLESRHPTFLKFKENSKKWHKLPEYKHSINTKSCIIREGLRLHSLIHYEHLVGIANGLIWAETKLKTMTLEFEWFDSLVCFNIGLAYLIFVQLSFRHCLTIQFKWFKLFKKLQTTVRWFKRIHWFCFVVLQFGLIQFKLQTPWMVWLWVSSNGTENHCWYISTS